VPSRIRLLRRHVLERTEDGSTPLSDKYRFNIIDTPGTRRTSRSKSSASLAASRWRRLRPRCETPGVEPQN